VGTRFSSKKLKTKYISRGEKVGRHVRENDVPSALQAERNIEKDTQWKRRVKPIERQKKKETDSKNRITCKKIDVINHQGKKKHNTLKTRKYRTRRREIERTTIRNSTNGEENYHFQKNSVGV